MWVACRLLLVDAVVPKKTQCVVRNRPGLTSKLVAECDPVPTFLKLYNNEVGKEAHEARAGSLAPLDS